MRDDLTINNYKKQICNLKKKIGNIDLDFKSKLSYFMFEYESLDINNTHFFDDYILTNIRFENISKQLKIITEDLEGNKKYNIYDSEKILTEYANLIDEYGANICKGSLFSEKICFNNGEKFNSLSPLSILIEDTVFNFHITDIRRINDDFIFTLLQVKEDINIYKSRECHPSTASELHSHISSSKIGNLKNDKDYKLLLNSSNGLVIMNIISLIIGAIAAAAAIPSAVFVGAAVAIYELGSIIADVAVAVAELVSTIGFFSADAAAIDAGMDVGITDLAVDGAADGAVDGAVDGAADGAADGAVDGAADGGVGSGGAGQLKDFNLEKWAISNYNGMTITGIIGLTITTIAIAFSSTVLPWLLNKCSTKLGKHKGLSKENQIKCGFLPPPPPPTVKPTNYGLNSGISELSSGNIKDNEQANSSINSALGLLNNNINNITTKSKGKPKRLIEINQRNNKLISFDIITKLSLTKDYTNNFNNLSDFLNKLYSYNDNIFNDKLKNKIKELYKINIYSKNISDLKYYNINGDFNDNNILNLVNVNMLNNIFDENKNKKYLMMSTLKIPKDEYLLDSEYNCKLFNVKEIKTIKFEAVTININNIYSAYFTNNTLYDFQVLLCKYLNQYINLYEQVKNKNIIYNKIFDIINTLFKILEINYAIKTDNYDEKNIEKIFKESIKKLKEEYNKKQTNKKTDGNSNNDGTNQLNKLESDVIGENASTFFIEIIENLELVVPFYITYLKKELNNYKKITNIYNNFIKKFQMVQINMDENIISKYFLSTKIINSNKISSNDFLVFYFKTKLFKYKLNFGQIILKNISQEQYLNFIINSDLINYNEFYNNILDYNSFKNSKNVKNLSTLNLSGLNNNDTNIIMNYNNINYIVENYDLLSYILNKNNTVKKIKPKGILYLILDFVENILRYNYNNITSMFSQFIFPILNNKINDYRIELSKKYKGSTILIYCLINNLNNKLIRDLLSIKFLNEKFLFYRYIYNNVPEIREYGKNYKSLTIKQINNVKKYSDSFKKSKELFLKNTTIQIKVYFPFTIQKNKININYEKKEVDAAQSITMLTGKSIKNYLTPYKIILNYNTYIYYITIIKNVIIKIIEHLLKLNPNKTKVKISGQSINIVKILSSFKRIKLFNYSKNKEDILLKPNKTISNPIELEELIDRTVNKINLESIKDYTTIITNFLQPYLQILTCFTSDLSKFVEDLDSNIFEKSEKNKSKSTVKVKKEYNKTTKIGKAFEKYYEETAFERKLQAYNNKVSDKIKTYLKPKLKDLLEKYENLNKKNNNKNVRYFMLFNYSKKELEIVYQNKSTNPINLYTYDLSEKEFDEITGYVKLSDIQSMSSKVKTLTESEDNTIFLTFNGIYKKDYNYNNYLVLIVNKSKQILYIGSLLKK